MQREFGKERKMRFHKFVVVILAVCLLASVSMAFAVKPGVLSLLPKDADINTEGGRITRNALSFCNRFVLAARMAPAGYVHCLHAFPLATESLTAGAMACLGDYLAQSQSQSKSKSAKRNRIDYRRNFSFVLKGLGEGVLWSFWYRFAKHLSQQLTSGFLRWVGRTPTASPFIGKIMYTIFSVGLDVLMACPFIYVFWDIPFLSVATGKSFRQVPTEIRKKILPMLKASMMLWTPVNMVIYNAPLEFRVILSSFADVVWQCAMSVIVVGPGQEDPLDEVVTGATVIPSNA